MLLMSYTYICSSSTTIKRFRFNLTANIDVGNVSSHIVDCRFRQATFQVSLNLIKEDTRFKTEILCSKNNSFVTMGTNLCVCYDQSARGKNKSDE